MKYVAYHRVSTAKQGKSQLGLEAQRTAVLAAIADGELIAEFTEIETGKNNQRPELRQALDLAELTGATLIVAKLDRLSRNAAFLNQLFDSAVPIHCADMPFADRFTIGILAQVAQWEREQISARTKSALQAAKARGRVLGGKRAQNAPAALLGRQRGMETRQGRAAVRRAKLAPHIAAAQAAGRTTLRSIADYLNERHIKAPRGGSWEAGSVARILDK